MSHSSDREVFDEIIRDQQVADLAASLRAAVQECAKLRHALYQAKVVIEDALRP